MTSKETNNSSTDFAEVCGEKYREGSSHRLILNKMVDFPLNVSHETS